MNSFFDDFYLNRTNCFSTAALQENANPPYNKRMAKACIDALASEPSSKINRYCRIYIAGRQVNPFEAKDLIEIASDYPSLETIDWDVFSGGAEFMIFLNCAALFSNELANASRNFIGNFYTRFDPDGVSIEHHIIIGRYGETPFGVHVDDATDRVFHFNVGPTSKELILWPRNEFLKTYGQRSSRPFSKTTRKGATCYEIPVGSCFFLPADYYHVGRSPDGVSVVIALAFSRQNFDLQLNDAIKELCHFSQVSDDSEKYYKNFLACPDMGDFATTSQTLNSIGLDTLLEHARARRKSNNYFVEISTLEQSTLNAKITRYRLSSISPPQLVRTDNTLHLYSRGHHAKLTDAAHIKEVEATLSQPYFELGQKTLNQGLAMKNLAIVTLAWLITTGGAVRV